jgi:peroxiredoxin
MRIPSLMIVVIAGLNLPQSVHAQPQPPKITGQVIDSDGKPVAGADVAAWWNADAGKMHPFQGVKTDKEGKFSLPSEGAFGQAVLVLDSERKAGAVKLFKGESLTLNFQLGPLVKVHGSVFSKELNKLPPWTTVSICMSHAPSYPRVVQCRPKEKGFDFLLPAGEYTFLAEGSQVEQLRKNLTLSEDKPDLDLKELNMEATATARLTDKSAPAWTVTAARGVKKDIKPSDFKGKWVLLLFWSSAHVTFNNYDLTRLIDLCESRAKDRDKFEIVLFHDNTIKDFEQLDAKLKKSKEMFWQGRDLPFPVLLDSTGQTFKAFGIRGLSSSLLIDPQGKVVGPAWQEELEAKLPELPLNVRVVNALDKLFTVYFDDPPLDRAVQILSDQSKISIRLDKEKLEAEGIAPDDIMVIKFKGILSLRSALNLLLDGMELGYEQDDKGLIVRPRKIGKPRANKMSEAQRSSAKRLEKMLDQRVTFNFLNMPLNSAVGYFQNTMRENFVLDPADRRAHLLDLNTKVTGSAKDVRLREALTELLRPYKMSFEVRDEAVVLKFKAPERLGVRPGGSDAPLAIQN